MEKTDSEFVGGGEEEEGRQTKGDDRVESEANVPYRVQNSPEPTKPMLLAAVENGDTEQVRKLLNEGADVEETFRSWSPVMSAAEENHGEIVQLLIDHGASLNKRNRKGRTALSFAVAPSNKRPTASDAIARVLEVGADVDQEDENGCGLLQ